MSTNPFAKLIEEAKNWQDDLPIIGRVIIYRRNGSAHELFYWTCDAADVVYSKLIDAWLSSPHLLEAEDDAGTSLAITAADCAGIELCADERRLSFINLAKILWDAKAKRWGDAFDPQVAEAMAEVFPLLSSKPEGGE